MFLLTLLFCTCYLVSASSNSTATTQLEKGKCPNRNEVWTECGSACPAYCGESEPQMCITLCVPGCFCKSGFIRERTTGKCISKRKCERLSNPCARVRCGNCTTCEKDTHNVPHCIPSSNHCCPPLLQPVQCFANPCSVNKCSYPGANCVSYYCGGCEAHFYDQNWNRLTNEQCQPTAAASITLQ